MTLRATPQLIRADVAESHPTQLARWINPIVRGWLQYYGTFYRSVLFPLLRRINAYLMRWIRKKHKRLRKFRKALRCWQRITSQHPRLFAHWVWTPTFW